MLGAPHYGAPTKEGRVYVVFGREPTESECTTGFAQVLTVNGTIGADELRSFSLADCALEIIGRQDHDGFGVSVRVPGDVTGDGIDDLLLAEFNGDGTTAFVFLVEGRPNFAAALGTGTYTAEVADWVGASPPPGVHRMATVSPGRDFQNLSTIDAPIALSNGSDVDSDGVADFAIGVPEEDAVYIVPGAALPVQLTDAERATGFGAGLGPGDEFGWSVDLPGDIDGDGLPDVVVGTWAQAWYLHTAPTDLVNPTVLDVAIDVSADCARPEAAVEAAGDVNADGIDDLLVGCYREAGSLGAAWLRYGSQSRLTWTGLTETHEGVMDANFALVQVSGTDGNLGRAMAGARDLDGDSFPDVALGGPGLQVQAAGNAAVLTGAPQCQPP